MAKIQIKSDKRTLLEEYFLNKEQFDNIVKERNVSSMVTTFAWKTHVFNDAKAQVLSSCTERDLIGRRTRSDWVADGIRSGGGRNPIGRRTESDRAADANGGKMLGAMAQRARRNGLSIGGCVKTRKRHALKGQHNIAQGSALG